MKGLKMSSKHILVFFLLAVTTNCYSQITTIAAPKEKEKEVLKYDSLESLNYENAPLHVGQTVFLKADSYAKEHGFYCAFYTKKVSRLLSGKNVVYKPVKRSNEEKIVSDYAALAGKYYKVISVEQDGTGSFAEYYWMGLLAPDDTLFYYTFTKSKSLSDFVTLGYYEKMKQTFVGKEFYTTGRYKLEKIDVKEEIVLPYKIKFKCTDIAVNVGEDGPIFAVLENEKYGKIKGVIIKGKKLDNFITVAYYNQCIKNYGAKFGSWVAEGKIVIGMNRNMVRDAWGSPDHINTTRGSFGVHEQWVYPGNRYLYFQNGKLTSIQS